MTSPEDTSLAVEALTTACPRGRRSDASTVSPARLAVDHVRVHRKPPA
ncbi:hypothetical protein [Nonomuraea roseoviolacea]